MILSDLECLSEIFNDMKHRAVSLRQLNFLYIIIIIIIITIVVVIIIIT